MCGIAGAVLPRRRTLDEAALKRMLGPLSHRGPDDEGIWREGGVLFGHRRLAIIDLSPTGRQPMVSACGRWVITINGEIYNYKELRAEVEADSHVSWRGTSDIEVLLEAVACFGVSAALEKAIGMFAMALWDRREERLTLARDRLGEKPLYWAEHAGGLVFASELTALEAVPDLDLSLSRPAISAFLRLGYVPAPLSILAGAAKLAPGWRLDWRANEGAKLAPYWSLAQVIEAGAEAPLSDPDAAVAELERLLGEVVAEQMVADVPLGVFLSGGIDSSTVAAMMSKAAQAPIKTFTIGFSEPRFDESAHAEAVAAHLGAEHRTHIFTTADAQALAPDLAAKWDEPFADPSQIPTLLLAAMARDEVKVCLTGDGGDEMFAGYVRYWGVPKLWRAVRRAPLRGCAAALARAAPLALLEAGSGFFAGIGEDYAARGRMAPALRRAAGWIGARSEDELYERTMSAWFDPEVLTGAPLRDPAVWRGPGPLGVDPLCAMQWRDAIDYLPGDILCKLDRAAMSVSLETRAPLLDARIAAFAFRLPEVMKVRGGVGKWLLREVLARHVPRALFERPKLGFSVPLHDWLTGDLRNWAEGLLAPVRRQGLLDAGPIEKLWRRYLAGDSSADHRIWTVLMFQSWLAGRAG